MNEFGNLKSKAKKLQVALTDKDVEVKMHQ